MLGLVGKAITFDSGGLSLKPADRMEEMKTDMGGGGAVLAAMGAIAELEASGEGARRSSRPARTCPAAARTGPGTSSPH